MERVDPDDSIKEDFFLIMEAMCTILDLKGTVGQIKCPKCGGILQWSRASTNQHIWGKCKTENCLMWAQ